MCNAELMNYFRCASAFCMKCQHDVSVHSAFSAKLVAFNLSLLPTFISAFENTLAFGLGYSRL